MRWTLSMLLLCGSSLAGAFDSPSYQDFEQPPHSYWQRTLNDPFTRLKADLDSGIISLDRTSERAFLVSLLKALDIPSSSQMLVFSTTSLQLRLIRTHNPRALFFNEDVYLGFVPNGQIEIVSLDPEVGGIFYLMDIPREDRPLRIERSARCMNCHAAAETSYLPGLTIKSSVPGPNGGTVASFRQERVGHAVPFEERFGGWYVTGRHAIPNHWGNLSGRLFEGELTKIPLDPGSQFRVEKYPHPSSDILPQLIHEHQAGFVNRVLEASYRTRTALHISEGKLSAGQMSELDEQSNLLTRYLLFADEAKLPGPVEGDESFREDFLKTRRIASNGLSLKDFDLQTRLFKHRCSYMIYSRVFNGLPAEMKQRVYRRLGEALNTANPEPEYAWLPAAEKNAIRAILKETLSDLPAGW
ncbi:MAG: hypothetical protein ACR2OZ_03515 [Verrucomicrobiales bacterium]